MSKNQKRPKNWHEALELITRCPVCTTSFEAPSARLVNKDAHANKVHLTCKQCGSYALVMIVMMKGGVSSVGIVTDLSYQDVARTQEAGEITTDELIEAYQYLQNLKTNTMSMARLKLIPEK